MLFTYLFKWKSYNFSVWCPEGSWWTRSSTTDFRTADGDSFLHIILFMPLTRLWSLRLLFRSRLRWRSVLRSLKALTSLKIPDISAMRSKHVSPAWSFSGDIADPERWYFSQHLTRRFIAHNYFCSNLPAQPFVCPQNEWTNLLTRQNLPCLTSSKWCCLDKSNFQDALRHRPVRYIATFPEKILL